MNSPHVSCSENDDERFTRTDVSADAVTAAWIRDEFTKWLRRRTGLDATRVCDVVLAVNEALANSAGDTGAKPIPGTGSAVGAAGFP